MIFYNREITVITLEKEKKKSSSLFDDDVFCRV